MLNILGMEISTKKLIDSLIYLVVVFVIYLILTRILKLILKRSEKRKISVSQKQKIKTVYQMISSVLRYLMIILVVLVILADIGVNVTSLLAGLGIMAAILGLAFQDLLKDFIAGVAILLEGQFCVGDTVEIDGFKGEVSNIGLKTTEIKDSAGHVKIISNRNVDGLINYNKQVKSE